MNGAFPKKLLFFRFNPFLNMMFWLPGTEEYSEAAPYNFKTAHEKAALPACFANLYLDGNINNSPFDGNCNQVTHGYCSR